MTQIQPEQCSRPVSGKTVKLHAKAYPVGSGVEWALDSNSPPPKGSRAEVKVKKGSAGEDIEIHIVPTHGLKISFDRDDPIWISEGTQCPPPSGIGTNQIAVVDCTDSKLTIHDSNDRACTLVYQLNFIGAKPLDPMIRNGGR